MLKKLEYNFFIFRNWPSTPKSRPKNFEKIIIMQRRRIILIKSIIFLFNVFIVVCGGKGRCVKNVFRLINS